MDQRAENFQDLSQADQQADQLAENFQDQSLGLAYLEHLFLRCRAHHFQHLFPHFLRHQRLAIEAVWKNRRHS